MICLKGKAAVEIMGEGDVFKELTRRVVERALEGEMTEHLGDVRHAQKGRGSGNSRNGKTVQATSFPTPALR